ncbi:MAG: hypothetical protein JW712_13530 [Dehalococcoidales bacterium]|nr:hypothetical protein [Dehalococcoidales bacterium]
MPFQSILFECVDEKTVREKPHEPDCFSDLFLDQIVDAVTWGRKEFNLKPFFYTSLQDSGTVLYRQEIMQELENESLRERIKSFTEKMVATQRYLAMIHKINSRYSKEGWFLDAADIYCKAVLRLERDLDGENLKSRGMKAFRDYISEYVHSEEFTALVEERKILKAELATVRYTVHMKNLKHSMLDNGLQVTVRKYDGEPDYSEQVEQTFEKFKKDVAKDYRVEFTEEYYVSPLETQILNCVARLYPGIFSRLDRFYREHGSFVNTTVSVFVREVQFFIAYLEFISRFKQSGLKFCYPQVTDTNKDIFSTEGFDLALANKLYAENLPVVCNDFYIRNNERILVVSGPNQGGKTTFARSFGQAHYLSSLGCPVPGSEAKLFLFDTVFTHFEKAQYTLDLKEKLNDDMTRINNILKQATPRSMVIINEIFTSTTLRDAIFLSTKIVEQLLKLDLLGLWVTFVDELASCSDKTVSMVSTVAPDNPAIKTFKILRKPADGLTYALTIAEKYGVTYKSIKERIKV